MISQKFGLKYCSTQKLKFLHKFSCILGSLTIPPFPTNSLPTSNCGFNRTIISKFLPRSFIFGSKTFFAASETKMAIED